MAGFSATIGKWAAQTEQRIDAVYARSVELLGEELSRTRPEGGRVPFQIGNLSRSLLADKSAMPTIKGGPFTGNNVGLIAASLKASEFVYLGYQAAYARRQNFGYIGTDALGRTYNQQGAHFVEGAAAEWPNIVRQAVSEIRGQS